MVGSLIRSMFALSLSVAAVMIMSPVRADDLVEAKKDFQARCSSCHGLNARGNGPAAASLKVPPADLTQISRRNGGVFPKSRVFETILGIDRPLAHGSQEMPVWGDIFLDETIGGSVELDDASRAARDVGHRIDDLVAYIESIQQSK